MKNKGSARHARHLSARSLIGAWIVTAGLSGSIIAAGETLSYGGVRPPDVTVNEQSTTTSEQTDKPKAAKKKRNRRKTTTTTVVIAPAEQVPEVAAATEPRFLVAPWLVGGRARRAERLLGQSGPC